MGLIRSHAPLFGFSFDGFDAWMTRKSEENYSVLYRDYTPQDKLCVALEMAIRGDENRWARQIGEIYNELDSLKDRVIRDKGRRVVENVKKTKDGYEVTEQWY